MDALETIKLKLSNRLSRNRGAGRIVPIAILDKNKKIILICKDKGKIDAFESNDGFNFALSTRRFNTPLQIKALPHSAILPNSKDRKEFVAYFGDRSINFATSLDKKKWSINTAPLITSSRPLEVGTIFERQRGHLLLFFEKEIHNKILYYSLHLALFEKNNPSKLLWKTNEPLWKQKDIWEGQEVNPLGSIFLNEKIITYWHVNNEKIYGVVLSGFVYDPDTVSGDKVKLKKHITNPIISPAQDNEWEAFNTFNPAALVANNEVHILYRAQGYDYISSVGYARSIDGIAIQERLDKPVYQPTALFESNNSNSVSYDFMSGGGYGGCEDPRVTLLENKVYMTYVAFDGWSPPRLAITSIMIEDFLQKKWNWAKPVLISPPNVIDKSGCLLPEKIGKKYVFFHRVFPNILIDYVDNLDFDGKTKWLKGEHKIEVRPDKWDSRKIGAGAPPIKTKDGWLLIYYGVDDKDDSKYHIGAMLLDLRKPEKVLYRSDTPILQPTEEYENNGFKPGITYPCGAVVVKNQLMVYYGGADSVVCVATADLDTFLDELKRSLPARLHNIHIKEIEYA